MQREGLLGGMQGQEREKLLQQVGLDGGKSPQVRETAHGEGRTQGTGAGPRPHKGGRDQRC